MIMSKHPVRFLEISYKDDATKQHFRRAKNFILSMFEKDFRKWSRELERMIFKTMEEGCEFVLQNGSSFYCGTASSRTGERGGTVQGILFTESAHYPDTGILSASEIIESSKNMLQVGTGLVFEETTANGYNHYQKRWKMAEQGKTSYKPRFFSWREYYTEEEFELIKNEFTDKDLIAQEYPDNPTEAFLLTGRSRFNQPKLKDILQLCSKPLQTGYLRKIDNHVNFIQDDSNYLEVWEFPLVGYCYLICADTATGKEVEDANSKTDYHVCNVLKWTGKTWVQVAKYRSQVPTDIYADQLDSIGRYYNQGYLVVERNNDGTGILNNLLRIHKYPNLYYEEEWDKRTETKSRNLGIRISGANKDYIISKLDEFIRNDMLYINSENTISELMSFVRNGNKLEASSGCHDDEVMSLANGIWASQFVPVYVGSGNGISSGRGILNKNNNLRNRIGELSYMSY